MHSHFLWRIQNDNHVTLYPLSPACSDLYVGLASEQMLNILPFRKYILLQKESKYIWLINLQS